MLRDVLGFPAAEAAEILDTTAANNQPAVVYYLPDPCAPIWRAGSLLVLGLRGDRVCAVTRFGDHGLLARFGLPRTLPRD